MKQQNANTPAHSGPSPESGSAPQHSDKYPDGTPFPRITTTSGGNARLHANGDAYPLQLRLAATFTQRLRGLLGRPPLKDHPITEGLLITRCPSIHTLFMSYPIDIVYLGAHGEIVRCVSNLAPWRACLGGKRAVHALELPSGSIRRLNISPGHRLEYSAFTQADAPY